MPAQSRPDKEPIAGQYGPATKASPNRKTPASRPPGWVRPVPKQVAQWKVGKDVSLTVLGFESSEGEETTVEACVVKTKKQTLNMTNCTLPASVNPFSTDGTYMALPIYQHAPSVLLVKTANLDALITQIKHHNAFSVKTSRSVAMKALLKDPKVTAITKVLHYKAGDQSGQGRLLGWKDKKVLQMEVTCCQHRIFTMDYDIVALNLTTTSTKIDYDGQREEEDFRELMNAPPR